MAKKKAKKATKKSTKKATKKTAKKASRKATKKAAKATKKTAKTSAKKATKKASMKATTKKATKKARPMQSVVKNAMPNLEPAKVKVGAAVPNFSLPATGGKHISLAGLKGKNLVLFFYPKDATPGCTLEGHEFTKLHESFKGLNTEVLGVSRDDLKSHEKFKTKECYSVDLISDQNEDLCKTFGVIKMKNMYGKQVRGIERSTFIIDAQGNLVKEWRGVKPEGHAAEVLSFVKNLNSTPDHSQQ